jgi:hypothetical protein
MFYAHILLKGTQDDKCSKGPSMYHLYRYLRNCGSLIKQSNANIGRIIHKRIENDHVFPICTEVELPFRQCNIYSGNNFVSRLESNDKHGVNVGNLALYSGSPGFDITTGQKLH